MQVILSNMREDSPAQNITSSPISLRVFGKTALTYSAGNVVLRFTSFLLIPLYTRSLSTSDYGLLATLLLVVQFMTMLMDMGTSKALVRFAPEYREDNRSSELIGTSYLINIGSGLLLTSVAIIFLKPVFRGIFHTEIVTEYILLACGAALAQSLFSSVATYFRTSSESTHFVLTNLTAAIALILVNLVLLHWLHMGVRSAMIAQIATYGTLWLAVTLMLVGRTGVRVSIRGVAQFMRYGVPLIFVVAGQTITDTSAAFFLSYFKDLETVAIYSLAYKIAQIAGMTLILPFQLAYEPFVFTQVNNPGVRATIARLLTYLMVAFAFVGCAIAFVSKDVIQIIAPPNYLAAHDLICLILPGVAFGGVFYVAESLLHIEHKTHMTGITVSAATIVSIVVAYVAIPLFGVYGAILASTLGVSLSAVLLLRFGMKVFAIPLETSRLAIIAGVAILLLVSTLALSKTGGYVYHSLLPIIAVAVFATLYFGRFWYEDERRAMRTALGALKIKVSNGVL